MLPGMGSWLCSLPVRLFFSFSMYDSYITSLAAHLHSTVQYCTVHSKVVGGRARGRVTLSGGGGKGHVMDDNKTKTVQCLHLFICIWTCCVRSIASVFHLCRGLLKAPWCVYA